MAKVQAVDEFIEKSTKKKPKEYGGRPPSGLTYTGAFGSVPTNVNLSGTGIKIGGSRD